MIDRAIEKINAEMQKDPSDRYTGTGSGPGF